MGRGRLLLMCVLVSALVPCEASAGFLEWLEKMSGPGPFTGWGVSVPVYCHPIDKPGPVASGKWSWDCWPMPSNKRRVTVYVDWATLKTGTNDLPYQPDVVAGQSKDVHLKKLVGAVDVRLDQALDVGVGLGRASFSIDRAPHFSRVVFQPVRLRLRPAMLFVDRRDHGGQRPASVWEFFSVSASLTRIGTVTAADLGATGTFTTEGEFSTEFVATVDVVKLLAGAHRAATATKKTK